MFNVKASPTSDQSRRRDVATGDRATGETRDTQRPRRNVSEQKTCAALSSLPDTATP
jgi:hypothetical protein